MDNETIEKANEAARRAAGLPTTPPPVDDAVTDAMRKAAGLPPTKPEDKK